MFEVFATVFSALMSNSLFQYIVGAACVSGSVLLVLAFFGRGGIES